VIVRLSTGLFRNYALADVVAQPGDEHTFTAALGGYHADVRVRVVDRGGEPACVASIGKLSR
jgi:hypothetical protein